MTAFGYADLWTYDEYVLTVHTPTYFERHDLDPVRKHLSDE